MKNKKQCRMTLCRNYHKKNMACKNCTLEKKSFQDWCMESHEDETMEIIHGSLEYYVMKNKAGKPVKYYKVIGETV